MSSGAVPGWYGKLPTLGDFASRRLDPLWIARWDAWLAAGLAALRDASGDAWLDRYLASPPWRFALMRDALPGSAACAGVLMASVDRVGRYFPLTLAAPLGALPQSPAALDGLLGWLHDLEDAAADALHDDWSIERLEAELAALPCPCSAAEGAGDSVDHGADDASAARALLERWPEADSACSAAAPASPTALAALFVDAVARRGRAAFDGAAFWLAATEQPPRLLMTRGLPAGNCFAALFGTESAPAD